MIPFATEWELQADNGKTLGRQNNEKKIWHKFKAQRETPSRHIKHRLSQANHKTYIAFGNGLV